MAKIPAPLTACVHLHWPPGLDAEHSEGLVAPFLSLKQVEHQGRELTDLAQGRDSAEAGLPERGLSKGYNIRDMSHQKLT